MSLTFSQRHGHEPLPEAMKVGELSRSLRVALWNIVRRFLEDEIRDHTHLTHFTGNARRFVERVLGGWSDLPEDEISHSIDTVMASFKSALLDAQFNKVLDLLEILVNDVRASKFFLAMVANAFDKHVAAYRLNLNEKPYGFFPQSTEEQGNAVRKSMEALSRHNMEGAVSHLRKASKRMRSGDWGDSIRESIHAVESVARRIDPKASETLAPALNSLEEAGLLMHRDLKEGIKKLYWYTCDEQSIRHALLDQSSADVALDEALFMFGACASFAAYLATKKELLGD